MFVVVATVIIQAETHFPVHVKKSKEQLSQSSRCTSQDQLCKLSIVPEMLLCVWESAAQVSSVQSEHKVITVIVSPNVLIGPQICKQSNQTTVEGETAG